MLIIILKQTNRIKIGKILNIRKQNKFKFKNVIITSKE